LVVTLALARGLSASLPCALSWPAWQGQTLMTGFSGASKLTTGYGKFSRRKRVFFDAKT